MVLVDCVSHSAAAVISSLNVCENKAPVFRFWLIPRTVSLVPAFQVAEPDFRLLCADAEGEGPATFADRELLLQGVG